MESTLTSFFRGLRSSQNSNSLACLLIFYDLMLFVANFRSCCRCGKCRCASASSSPDLDNPIFATSTLVVFRQEGLLGLWKPNLGERTHHLRSFGGSVSFSPRPIQPLFFFFLQKGRGRLGFYFLRTRLIKPITIAMTTATMIM